jgi:two-component system sensor histidine kinase UhpB
MSEPTTSPSPTRSTRYLLSRDIAIVAGVTVVSVIGAAHFNLSEAVYAFSRAGERFQIDELPVGVLVLLAGLMWLTWRRYRQAHEELTARELAESRLARALADNRELARENLRIQEVERKHLARELHDELGQYLNAIKLDATAICDSNGTVAEFSVGTAAGIIATVDRIHGAVSAMIARLRPVGLDELGLVAAIECCIDQWRQRLPETQFTLSVQGDVEGLTENLNLTLYRVIQESLTNAQKHANAKRIQIVAERLRSEQGDEVRVSVADDGRGMEAGIRNSRFGLTGMRERVEMLGGTFALQSAPGNGVRVEARLPIGEGPA